MVGHRGAEIGKMRRNHFPQDWGQTVLGRGKGTCKGPEVRMSVRCVRNIKKGSVTRAEPLKGRGMRYKMRLVTLRSPITEATMRNLGSGIFS